MTTDAELADEIERRRDSEGREYAQLALSYSQWQQIIAALRREPAPTRNTLGLAHMAAVLRSAAAYLRAHNKPTLAGDCVRCASVIAELTAAEASPKGKT